MCRKMAGPGTLRALGSEGWGRLRPLLCWSPGMHTCEDMWQFPYGRMVHQTHFTARVVSACCASCRRLPHRTRALVWTLCPRPDTQPSMPEGLGPRVLSPSPLHTHTHTAPALCWDMPQLLLLTVHVQGTGCAQSISGSEKSCCLAQGGPAPRASQGLGCMATLADPREAGALSPQCTLAALPAAILLLPWVSLLATRP